MAVPSNIDSPNFLIFALQGSFFLDHRDLVQAIDDQRSNAARHGEFNLVLRFVIAMERNAGCIRSGPQRKLQLSFGHHVQAEPFLVHQADHLADHECFRSIGHINMRPMLSEAADIVAAPFPDSLFIHHI
ncbi:hypothetical protein D3C84_866690 [compost metagenome]